MKGIVFTEFLDMVEEKFSEKILEEIIEQSDLSTDGAYTSIGTYDHHELVQLVVALSQQSQIPVPTLVHTFGEHLFGRFATLFPRFFEGVESTFAFLEQIDQVVHVEVLKLYPEAELPKFECEITEPGKMQIVYSSPRSFEDLAEGLMAGCAKHYGEQMEIKREDISNQERKATRFFLTMT
ncbi:heme NO-binding domain-containing protein [Oligoflexia bacterium]|nr:heme NO-binding domain-containing protein [Oligoflexia bacterium]